jgi:hypothetical protein
MSDLTKTISTVDEPKLSSENKFSELSSVLLSQDKPETKLSHEECLVLIQNMRELILKQNNDIFDLQLHLGWSKDDVDLRNMELERQRDYIDEICENLDRHIIDQYDTVDTQDELKKKLNYPKYSKIYI